MTENMKNQNPVSNKMPTDEIFRLQARVMRAVSSEARLKIVWRLHQGECSVGELTELVGLDPSTVSKHLATLRAAGIVDDRREGSWVFYRLVTPCITSVLACATTIISSRRQ
jgi:DNA-binding transcriptional ArsR family regulator